MCAGIFKFCNGMDGTLLNTISLHKNQSDSILLSFEVRASFVIALTSFAPPGRFWDLIVCQKQRGMWHSGKKKERIKKH